MCRKKNRVQAEIRSQDSGTSEWLKIEGRNPGIEEATEERVLNLEYTLHVTRS